MFFSLNCSRFLPFSLVKPGLSPSWFPGLSAHRCLLFLSKVGSSSRFCSFACFKKNPCNRKKSAELSHARFAGSSLRNFFQEMGWMNSEQLWLTACAFGFKFCLKKTTSHKLQECRLPPVIYRFEWMEVSWTSRNNPKCHVFNGKTRRLRQNEHAL